jgi:acetyl esterase
MTQVNLRLRAWAWLARRIASVAARSEADVIALQARRVPDTAVTRWLFGAVPPGVDVTSQLVPGPAGDIPVRIYRTAGDGSAVRPLILYFHGGGFVLGSLDLGNWISGTVAA